MTQVIFQTDQSGANQNICATAVASTVTFNFSLPSDYEVYSANIVLKKGSSTTAPILATIYSQPNGGGSAISSASVPASSITQIFSPVEFLFPPTSLVGGVSYSLVLSSTTSCSGSSPYSFKSGNFQVISKTTSQVINTGYAILAAMAGSASLGANSKLSTYVSVLGGFSSALLSSADLMKDVSCSCGAAMSFSAEAKADWSAEVSAGGVASLEGFMSGAKSLVSAVGLLESSSAVGASASVGYLVGSDQLGCVSSLACDPSLVVSASSEMDSSSFLEAYMDVLSSSRSRKREGSGHYVLNRGAFIFRRWGFLIKTKGSRNLP